MLSDDLRKKEVHEAKASFQVCLPYLRLGFPISSCHLSSSSQPCTGLAVQAGTKIGFAFLISAFPLSTTPLPHYHGYYVITIITTCSSICSEAS